MPNPRRSSIRSRGPERPIDREAALSRQRRLHIEQLEGRDLLTALPFGAMPDDTGEYMLGDVKVTVVLMESDGTKDASTENWTTDSINAVKANVQAGLNWWKDTLDALPNVRDGLLNFDIDWTYADTPVNTGYEPISRISNDFSLWTYDFLNKVGFNATGNFSSDIRAFNNFQRQQSGDDWAFTIFVVNNANDVDKGFADGGSFKNAFAFAGGRFEVVPASRPASTFAHETGHMFWAFDEYSGASANYLSRRGYYNTQNTNSASNPAPGFVQANSIMSNDDALSNPPRLTLTNAYNGHTSSQSSLETIGWKDSDGDGIFDVLDVPFKLSGTGSYNAATGLYHFTGSSSVATLPNQNTSGLQNDITINQIRVVQVQIDNGPWTTVLTLPARTYQTAIDVSFAVPAGQHTVHLQTADTRTGVTSASFSGDTVAPSQVGSPGISGFVFRDDDGDGVWDPGEPPLTDFGLEVVDENDEPIDLLKNVEPSVSPESTVLNTINPDATIAAVGGDVQNNLVKARTSSLYPSAGRVFTTQSIAEGRTVETWGSSRQLRVDFTNPVGVVSIRAYSGSGTSFGRLEAYDAQGHLLERFTSGAISGSNFVTMSIARPSADIAYVIAHGHVGTEVVLDTLQWGPMTSATSDTLGAYSLANLPAGTYRVKADPPPNHVVTTPTDGVATITVGPGQAVTGVNFGIHVGLNIWHNISHPLNVDGDADSLTTPIDALLIINWLNSHPNQPELPTDGDPSVDGYIDVNDDGLCTPLDALLVINDLNMPSGGSGGGGGGEGEMPALQLPGGDPSGEGEQAPRSAAEYYAQHPIHFAQIAGTALSDDFDEDPIPAAASSSPAGKAIAAPTTSSANPLLPLASSSDKGTTGQTSAKSFVFQQHTLQPHVAGGSPASARIAKSEKTSQTKSKLDLALDAIAADVSQAHAAQPHPAKLSVRRHK